MKEKLELAQQDVEKQLTYCNIITHPEIADKKAYPIRWLIVLGSILGTLLTALVVIAILENFRANSVSENA
jgi:capsule polysaccharide export protein KpsE/RkpR